jgi:hypothetical protein
VVSVPSLLAFDWLKSQGPQALALAPYWQTWRNAVSGDY